MDDSVNTSQSEKKWTLKKNWMAHTDRICALLGVGETIWSYSEDGTIKVWETETFAICEDWEISSHESGAMLLSSNNFVWVSSAYNGKLLVFNPEVSTEFDNFYRFLSHLDLCTRSYDFRRHGSWRYAY